MEQRVPTRQLGDWFKEQKKSRVVLETCSESFAVADEARRYGHDVRVVPAALAKALGVGARGIKTDVRDARNISEASARIELPSVHVPSKASRDVKTACGMREAVVASRTKLINTVRGWLRSELAPPLRRGSTETFADRVPPVSGKLSPLWINRGGETWT